MQDIIYGVVHSIIDSDTIIIYVTETGESNIHDYFKWELIRVAAINSTDTHPKTGSQKKDKLENNLQGKMVKCAVHGRNTNGEIIADVSAI